MMRDERTDQLREQAEREIAGELGFRVWEINGRYRIAGICDSSCGEVASPSEITLWQALVRDRCSLLEMRKAAEWIPVSERLPEHGKAVVVVINGIVQHMPAILLESEHDKWWEWLDSDADGAPIEAVTHWQPLPAPPVALEGK